jgi:hypothetical protein
MKTIITIGAYALGGYLLWDYFMKRGKNASIVNGSTGASSKKDLVAAGMEEIGEEGLAVALIQQQGSNTGVVPSSHSSADGDWDSDTVSEGLV